MLLSEIPERLGDIPIGVVFDFHANTTPAFVERGDVFAGYDTYSHVNPYDRGLEVYGLLTRLLSGETRPARDALRVTAVPPDEAVALDGRLSDALATRRL